MPKAKQLGKTREFFVPTLHIIICMFTFPLFLINPLVHNFNEFIIISVKCENSVDDLNKSKLFIITVNILFYTVNIVYENRFKICSESSLIFQL